MWCGPGHGSDTAAEAELWGLLVAELTHFQTIMGPTGGGYMLRGNHPTAADFSLFAQVERLVGTMGDAAMGAAVPDLLQERGLGRLWEWREGMLALHPISFRGKPVPGGKLRGGGWRNLSTPQKVTDAGGSK